MKLIPATVDSWDGKELRVHIPGYTDGASKALLAEVCYAFSDRPDRTGFKIIKGDSVWVIFNGGDENSPIVMGFRNQNTGGAKEIRRLEHTNVEFNANATLTENSKTHKISADSLFEVTSGKIVLKSNVEITGSLTTQGGISGGGGMSVTGNISASGHIHAKSVTDDDGDGGA